MPGDRGCLSPREFQVSCLVAEGRSNQDISKLLGVTVEAVKNHKANIKAKLGELPRRAVPFRVRDAMDKRGRMVVYAPICLGCLSNRCEHVSMSMYAGSAHPQVPPRLTSRQVAVVRLVGAGRTNKEVSYLLNLAVGTVKVYLVRIFHVLKVSSRLEVGLWACKHAALLCGTETGPAAGPLEPAGDIPLSR